MNFDFFLLFIKMNTEKKEKIRSHINKNVAIFKEKLMQLAIENNHPFVESYLQSCLYEIKKTINGNPLITGDEIVKFKMDLD